MNADSSGKKCLRPGCKHPSGCRGLCIVCYNAALMAIRFGKTTWAKLEKAGKAIPAKRAPSGKSKAMEYFTE